MLQKKRCDQKIVFKYFVIYYLLCTMKIFYKLKKYEEKKIGNKCVDFFFNFYFFYFWQNAICDKTQRTTCYKAQKLKILQQQKTQIVTIFKNLNFVISQFFTNLKLWHTSKIQIVTILKYKIKIILWQNWKTQTVAKD